MTQLNGRFPDLLYHEALQYLPEKHPDVAGIPEHKHQQA
jgi:hypothetical protein